MRNTQLLTTATLAIVGLFAAASNANASHRHVETVAHKLDAQIKQLAKHLQGHYRHTSQYRHLISDTRVMLRLSSHLHSVAHSGGSASHLSHDLQELHEEFHHIESLIEAIEHEAAHGNFGGHVHGDTRHVRLMLKQIDANLAHLEKDIHALLHPPVNHNHRRRIVVSSHNHSTHSRRTIHIGGSGFSIHIGH